MKKLVCNIGKITVIYVLFIFLLNLFCAVLIQGYFSEKSFAVIFIEVLCNQYLIDVEGEIVLNVVLMIKKLAEGIALAILTSYIFIIIINREAKIILPDKVVLRRRTSEGNLGKLTLGILVGNPNKTWLQDVKCSINCTYLKENGGVEIRNAETNIKQNVEFIQNYYRFSFDIEYFPKTFWQHFLEKNEEYLGNDFLIVTISGKKNGFGDYFRIHKRYSLQDIIVDVHSPEKNFKKKEKNFFTGQEKTKIDWKEFSKCIEAGELERQKIIHEIYEYVSRNS